MTNLRKMFTEGFFFVFLCFVLFVVLLCDVDSVWHCDYLNGEQGYVFFFFNCSLVCHVCCPSELFLHFLLLSLVGYEL